MQLCLVLVCCGLVVGPIWAVSVKMATVVKHNGVRKIEVQTDSASNIYELKWNSELAAKAAAWARRCQLGFSPDLDVNIAQNVFMAHYFEFRKPKAAMLIKNAVDSWMEEKSKNNGNFACCKDSSVDCCSYTQVVSSRSKEVGCAVEYCPGNQAYVVCNYKPGGNFNNQDAYLTGPPCSGCEGNDQCNRDKLCVSNKR